MNTDHPIFEVGAEAALVAERGIAFLRLDDCTVLFVADWIVLERAANGMEESGFVFTRSDGRTVHCFRWDENLPIPPDVETLHWSTREPS